MIDLEKHIREYLNKHLKGYFDHVFLVGGRNGKNPKKNK